MQYPRGVSMMFAVMSVAVLFPVGQVVAQDQGSIWTIVHQKHRHGHGHTPSFKHGRPQIAGAVAQQQAAEKQRKLQQDETAKKQGVLAEAEDLVKVLQGGDVSGAAVLEVDHKINAIGRELCNDKSSPECVRFHATKNGGNMVDRLRGLMVRQHSAMSSKMSQDLHSVRQDIDIAEQDRGVAVRSQFASIILSTVIVAITLAMQ